MADRQKDLDFVRALVEARLVDPAILEQRLASIDLAGVDSDQGEEALAYRQRKSIEWATAVQTQAGTQDPRRTG
ncbi:hypothetical protein [Arthrobacter sp. NPDC057009]|uniref:hypothetical protein n=1 Tax=Arthrobacter sp. NPDC057009 TaxID=3345996 RepID=UPI00362696BD